MSEACGCGSDDRNEGEQEPERLWEITELRAAAAAGWCCWPAMRSAGPAAPCGRNRPVCAGVGDRGLHVRTLDAAPVSARQDRVGTLMTIAAIGAVILGEVGEAAMLAFLFSISEGLEEYSLARTRRGLRALLALVPDEATVLPRRRRNHHPASGVAGR